MGQPAVETSAASEPLELAEADCCVWGTDATLDFRLFGGRHWGGYHFPRHLNLFSRATLQALAVRAGFEVAELGTQVSPVNWVYSLRNLLVDYGARLDEPRAGPWRAAARGAAPSDVTRPPVVVLGAGVAGLTAARLLKRRGLPVALWSLPDEALGERCVEGLRGIVPDARWRYLGCRVLRTPVAYPVFLREYEDTRLRWQQSSGVPGLLSVGRNGEFDHLLMEDVHWRTQARTLRLADELLAPAARAPRAS